jgi:hypothetical protein
LGSHNHARTGHARDRHKADAYRVGNQCHEEWDVEYSRLTGLRRRHAHSLAAMVIVGDGLGSHRTTVEVFTRKAKQVCARRKLGLGNRPA